MRQRPGRVAISEGLKVKWAIEIQQSSLDKRNLADLLQSLGFILVEGIEYPALASPTIDSCATAADAFEIAKDVRAAFKGPAKIDPEFVLGSVIDFSTTPARRHAFVEVDSCVIKVTTGTATVTISQPSGLSPAELDKWNAEYAERQYQAKLERQRALIEPAYFNPRAAKALELLSVEKPSGETLYKIYELAEGHPTNRTAFQTEFGITQEQFNRFKDAVHNPSVSGDWARHAYHRALNSPNPMTKSEAEEFVRSIADRWLDSVRRQIANST
jgi:hypothetical protein